MKKLALVSLFILVGCSTDDGGESPFDPAAALLSLPANNTICETGTSVSATHSDVVFSWEPSANTTSYDLVVENLETNAVQSALGLTETNATVKLKKGEPYSWVIESKNSQTSKTATSMTWKFYLAGPGTSNYAPFPAALLSPERDGAVDRNANGEVDFLWEGADPDSNDVLTYTLYVDKIDGKQPPSNALSNLNQESASVALEGSTKYYWRVLTSDGSNSSFSQVCSFTTQ